MVMTRPETAARASSRVTSEGVVQPNAGTADSPIVVLSSDGTGQGMCIRGAGTLSVLRHVRFDGLDTPFRAVFIRAPGVERVGDGVEVLATESGRPVLCRQGNVLGLQRARLRRRIGRYNNLVITLAEEGRIRPHVSHRIPWPDIRAAMQPIQDREQQVDDHVGGQPPSLEDLS